MFWENFYLLCSKMNTKPLRVVNELSISSGSITKWKNGSIPSTKTMQKLADYFGVTVEYFFINHKSQPSPQAIDEADVLLHKFKRLDEIDRGKVDAFIDGLLAADKYLHPAEKNIS